MFDFSNLYRSEEIMIAHDGKDLFSVTVQEIPHGVFADLQREMLKQMEWQQGRKDVKPDMARTMKQGSFDPSAFSDQKTLAGIRSWTLKDSKGNEAPITLEVYRQLPHSITEQIESAIERLNPELDEDFRHDDGS